MSRKQEFNGLFGIDIDKGKEGPSIEETTPNITIEKEIAYGESQGREGVKLPRVNAALGTRNYEWLKKESRYRGISMSQLLNDAIDYYINTPEGHRDPDWI